HPAAGGEPSASVRDPDPGRGVRGVDADLPQHRRVGVAGGDLPAAHARIRDRRIGLLHLVHQRNPRAVFPDAGQDGRHHRVVLPVRRHRRDRPAVRMDAGARNAGPFPRTPGGGRPDREDLRHHPQLTAPRPGSNDVEEMAVTTVDYNPFAPDFYEHAFDVYRRMRDEAPVSYSQQWGWYALTRFEDVRAAIL